MPRAPKRVASSPPDTEWSSFCAWIGLSEADASWAFLRVLYGRAFDKWKLSQPTSQL